MNSIELADAAGIARILNKSEIARFCLKDPPVFIKVNRRQSGIEKGTYTVVRSHGSFSNFVRDASTLEALLEFLSFGVVSTGETFEVTARNMIKCKRADGSCIYYDLHRDYRI
jgi:hypothetical protein